MPQQHCTTGQPLSLSEADFHECIVQFFRPFVSNWPMDWTCIKKSMTYFAPFFKFKIFGDLYFDYIYGLFEDFRIIDRAVITSCIMKYCRFKLNSWGFELNDPDMFPYPEDRRKICGVPRYEYEVMSKCIEELPSRPFLYRDLTALMRILRYEAPVCIFTKDVRYYARYVVLCIRKDPILYNVVFELSGYQGNGAMGARRFKLLLLVIDFLLQKRIENSQDAIKGLKILFQAIPDPYVTWQEIFEFLKRQLAIWPSESQLLYIKSFQESCAECFPKCLRVLKPRSLKHLAKCKVRRCLGFACTLPHGVWSLQLPKELEDYVLLQRRKDQFWPVVRPLSSDRVFVLGPVWEIQSHETLDLNPGP